MSTVLVTGGAGFIGSHTCVVLQQAGYRVVAVDNLCNSRGDVLSRVSQIVGAPSPLVVADVRDAAAMEALFGEHKIEAVVHFAGLKAVGESVLDPLRYYDNNVNGTLSLLRAMKKAGCRSLVFSSSATVYGDPASLPIREDCALSPTNPYGRSKLIIEDCLRDLYASDTSWNIAILRYFNPVGAHESGRIGESPNGVPNNLMPYIADVAAGRRAFLSVFGNDYPTPDGTGVRDYLHVVDLAQGHLKALEWLQLKRGIITVNLGTGRGVSVFEMVRAFERITGRQIPCHIAERRPGDVAVCFADPSFARQALNWSATRGLEEMCADVWRWHQGESS